MKAKSVAKAVANQLVIQRVFAEVGIAIGGGTDVANESAGTIVVAINAQLLRRVEL